MIKVLGHKDIVVDRFRRSYLYGSNHGIIAYITLLNPLVQKKCGPGA